MWQCEGPEVGVALDVIMVSQQEQSPVDTAEAVREQTRAAGFETGKVPGPEAILGAERPGGNIWVLIGALP